MKIYVLLFLCFLTAALSAEEKVDFWAPDGWRTEVIAMPPDFAPGMSWNGVEVLKFHPDMFKAEAENFFTYVFLLHMESGTPDWDEQLMLYYGGLAKAVAEDKNLDISDFRVEVEGEGDARYGKIKWIEPFATKKPQTLYLELRRLDDKNWFVCASPNRYDRPVWTEMREIRNEVEWELRG